MLHSPRDIPFQARVALLIELAKRLHACGTTAQRLEGAITGVARRLGVECEPWSNPTGMIFSFRDPDDPSGTTDTTRLIRMSVGETDLGKLCEVDHIAESVIAGEIDVQAGYRQMRELDAHPSAPSPWADVLSFGLVSAAVACLMRLPWADITTCGLAGLSIGMLMDYASRHEGLRESSEALAGILAAAIAIGVASWLVPLDVNTVIISAVIVLLPGMAFTNAVNELTSQHLVSGTARFAGALTTVLKIAIGTMVVVAFADALGLQPRQHHLRPQGWPVEAVGLLVAGAAFAVLFRAQRRDYLAVMLASISGYLISRLGGLWWGAIVGAFLAALALTAAGNWYGRWRNRPGAILRVPGIIMLVPGSVSLRGVISLVQHQDVSAGQGALLAVLNTLLALIAGLLFGNLLVPARRNL